MGTDRPNLIFVCKTYRNDLISFLRLYASYKQHNVDSIPLYLSVPEDDIELFKSKVDNDVIVVADESYAKKYFSNEELWGLSLGYVNQEICKLCFWENDFAENYLCIDSDVYFIRDFYVTDFMADQHTPYSVLVMDKDLNMEHFYRDFGEYRTSQIKKIFKTVGYEDRRLRTCHGMTVLNASVLKSLKNDFMKSKKLDYKALLKIAPFEYTWYNAWLQKSGVINVIAIEPFFKTFHMRIEYLLARLRLISEADLATQYVGVILNSNWKPKPAPQRYENPGRRQSILYKIVNKVG